MPKRPRNNPGSAANKVAPISPVQSLQSHVQTTAFAGPIPPPELLKQYNDVIPTAAERILAMAENENKHRHTQENKALEANINAQRKQSEMYEGRTKATLKSDLIGQTLGFIVSAGAVVGGIFLAFYDQPWAGAALFGLPLAGIIRAFTLRDKSGSQAKNSQQSSPK